MKKIDITNSKVLAEFYELSNNNSSAKIAVMLSKEQGISVEDAVVAFINYRYPSMSQEEKEVEMACLEFIITKDDSKLQAIIDKNVAKFGYLPGEIKSSIDCMYNSMDA